MHISWLHLHNRSVISLLRPDKVVNATKDDEKACYQNRPIHVLCIDFSIGRPEAEEQHEQEIYAGKCVVGDSKNAGNSPWTPYKFSSFGVGRTASVYAARCYNSTSTSTVQ